MASLNVGFGRAPDISRLMLLVVLTAGILAGLHGSDARRPAFTGSVAKVILKQVSVKPPAPQPPSVFQQELAMAPRDLMNRWEPLIAAAAKQFHLPQEWIRSVMRMESGGRTMLDENQPIVSTAGAMGLMQVMPETYEDMRAQYGLGAEPYDPHDNIFAGAAYLSALHRKYGYPAMFAAYNDGPGNLEQHLAGNRDLPQETLNYLSGITGTAAALRGGAANAGHATLTRPDGAPLTVDIASVRAVRAPLPGEYADGVQAVITLGRKRQGVREDPATVARLTLRTSLAAL